MRCFLRDADAKQDEDEKMRVEAKVQDCRGSCTLDAIRSRLQDISDTRDPYGIQNVGEGTNPASETLRKMRRSSPHGEERDIIDLENDKTKMVDQLIQLGGCWSAVSIVGMGGIAMGCIGSDSTSRSKNGRRHRRLLELADRAKHGSSRKNVSMVGKEELTISADGFPQLEFLDLNSVKSLAKLNVEASAVPRLQSFKIVNRKRLRMLPEEMKFVTSLRKLGIQEMPRVFVDRLQGEDLQKACTKGTVPAVFHTAGNSISYWNMAHKPEIQRA
ncbi:unnamed protein product [Dovyalis caffra]|uniref:Uncharacterized protein n=1 Tax=Dovyalis caffra TaxID=77055 RepID=A0AAV1RHE2_9ROSI|nr:unnamed protein product [Dovyalis caffra]